MTVPHRCQCTPGPAGPCVRELAELESLNFELQVRNCTTIALASSLRSQVPTQVPQCTDSRKSRWLNCTYEYNLQWKVSSETQNFRIDSSYFPEIGPAEREPCRGTAEALSPQTCSGGRANFRPGNRTSSTLGVRLLSRRHGPLLLHSNRSSWFLMSHKERESQLERSRSYLVVPRVLRYPP